MPSPFNPSDPFSLATLSGIRTAPGWPPIPPSQAGLLHTFQAGPVQVFALLLPPDPAPWIAQLQPLATPSRRERAARFHFPADTLRCLAAEALLRHALQEVHGLDANTLALQTGPHGKPSLADHPAIHFNLSHSGSCVLCALHDQPLGIDVEAENPRHVLPAQSILSPEEFRQYGALPPEAARTFFFRYWTLKESLLKALGTGLSLNPAALALTFHPAPITASHAGTPLAGWFLQELPMPEGLKASLCHR